ncbi:MAG: GNAT family N-acetyltransferase [Pseudomonadota bacterium]
MQHGAEIGVLTDPAAKREACRAITRTLPEWFGRPEANAAYADGMAHRDVLAANLGGAVVAVLATEVRFVVTLELWWLGVRRDLHRRGIGTALVARACDQARQAGLRYAAVSTLGPSWPDANYAATRAFYAAMGFAPIVEVETGATSIPMIWMVRAL